MTGAGKQFPFLLIPPAIGALEQMPFLPLTLSSASGHLTSLGLLDTAATMNVLPYSIGARLGFDWEEQMVSIPLAGVFKGVEAKAIALTAAVEGFAPVILAFAWAKTDEVRLLLGQINFFQEFDVCFYRSRGVFEMRAKQS